MGLSLCVFDWSGVISDDTRPSFAACNKVIKSTGHPPVKFDAWRAAYCLTIQEFWNSIGITGNHDALYELFTSYYEEEVRNGKVPTVNPGETELFKTLKENGCTIAILSSHPLRALEDEARLYGLRQHIDRMVGSAKEKANALAGICDTFKVARDQTTYTGDTAFDVAAGNTAGCIAIGITTGYHDRQRLLDARPFAVVDTLDELSALICRLHDASSHLT